MLSDQLYAEIEEEAHARSLRYQRDTAGRASGQTLNPRDHVGWWFAQVALERGRNWTMEDADREVETILNATAKQIDDDMRWRGECPQCEARKVSEAMTKALESACPQEPQE